MKKLKKWKKSIFYPFFSTVFAISAGKTNKNPVKKGPFDRIGKFDRRENIPYPVGTREYRGGAPSGKRVPDEGFRESRKGAGSAD